MKRIMSIAIIGACILLTGCGSLSGAGIVPLLQNTSVGNEAQKGDSQLYKADLIVLVPDDAVAVEYELYDSEKNVIIGETRIDQFLKRMDDGALYYNLKADNIKTSTGFLYLICEKNDGKKYYYDEYPMEVSFDPSDGKNNQLNNNTTSKPSSQPYSIRQNVIVPNESITGAAYMLYDKDENIVIDNTFAATFSKDGDKRYFTIAADSISTDSGYLFIMWYCNDGSKVKNDPFPIVESFDKSDGNSGTIRGAMEETQISIWGNEFTAISDFRYIYDEKEKTITLVRYQGGDTTILLSPVYCLNGENYQLVSIGDNACFYGEDKITKVYIPDGVKFIGKTTFNGCSSLTDIRLPASLEKIDKNFFTYFHGYEVVYNDNAILPDEYDRHIYEAKYDDTTISEHLNDTLDRLKESLADAFNEGWNSALHPREEDKEEKKVIIHFAGSEERWKEIISTSDN